MSWTFALQGRKGEGDEATAEQGTKRWEPWKESEEIGTQIPSICDCQCRRRARVVRCTNVAKHNDAKTKVSEDWCKDQKYHDVILYSYV